MAELAGLIASAVTLAGLVNSLRKVAHKWNNPSLDTYIAIVDDLEKTCTMITTLTEKTPSITDMSLEIDGKVQSMIESCSATIEIIVEDVRAFYQGINAPKDTLLKRVKMAVRRFRTTVVLVLNENEIRGLIDSAKHVESTLHTALLAILIKHSSVSRNEHHKLVEEFKGHVTTEINRFKEHMSSRPSRSAGSVPFRVRKKPIRSQRQIDKRQGNNIAQEVLATELDAICRPRSAMDGQCSDSAGISPFQAEEVGEEEHQEDREEGGGREEREKEEDEEEIEVAVLRLDGESDFLIDRGHSARGETSDEDDSSSVNSTDVESQAPLPAHDLSTSGDMSKSAFCSGSDALAVSTVTDMQANTLHGAVFDVVEVNVELDGAIFLDSNLDISRCSYESLHEKKLKFCARTIIVQPNGLATIIVKEVCGSEEACCSHVFISAALESITPESRLPCSLQAFLSQEVTTTSGSIDRLSQESFCLVGQKSCASKDLHTLVISDQGRSHFYAMKTRLRIGPNKEISENEEMDNDETEDLSSTVSSLLSQPESTWGDSIDTDDHEQAEESSDQVENEDTYSTVSPFAHVPCIFCSEDALSPKFDASGAYGLIVMRGDSFGYTCDRCQRRTWVSGVTFGLSGVGGSWCWFS